MRLENIDISENRIKALAKRGISSVEDVLGFYPRKYYDFTNPVVLHPNHSGNYVAVVGQLQSVKSDKKNETLMLKAKVLEPKSNKVLHVMWIGFYHLKKLIEDWKDETVIVCGKLEYHSEYRSFHMNNPIIIDKHIEKHLSIYPVYTKMTGISEDFMEEAIEKALRVQINENLPIYIVNRYKLLSKKESVNELHKPKSLQSLEAARKRMVYEDLLSFAIQLEHEERKISKGSSYNIKSIKTAMDYIDHLPFSLTESQRSCFEAMKEKAYNGLRINALIQGDVGTGKTAVAFLIMLAMADSGYQSVLMAPTIILATQHYNSLKAAVDKYGYKVALLTSDLKTKERRKLLQEISNGEYHFIIGTHGVLGESINYHNLGMVIIDEEHKFGVAQRELISDKAKYGVHKIAMSATPIPRTLANALYGTSVDVYDLQLPASRKQVQTAIFNNDQKIYEFILRKINAGQQAYVVCPYIDDPNEKSNVETVEQSFREYKNYFERYNIEVGYITGKMKQPEIDQVLEQFKKGNIKILIATTIVEVGVNVPNANIIVINNADRFGLSQLHQLRGRVGRGTDQGYCILKSAEKENPRLLVMCKTTNGYEIAKADMELRGTGDILGMEQSGKNKYINLMLQYPNMYNYVKRDAKELVDKGINVI